MKYNLLYLDIHQLQSDTGLAAWSANR